MTLTAESENWSIAHHLVGANVSEFTSTGIYIPPIHDGWLYAATLVAQSFRHKLILHLLSILVPYRGCTDAVPIIHVQHPT